MRDRSAETQAAGLEVYGISFDSVADNRMFAEKLSFPFPLLCDPDRRVGMAYGAADKPDAGYARRISYVIDEQGNVLHAYPKVSPNEHLDLVLRDLGAKK